MIKKYLSLLCGLAFLFGSSSGTVFAQSTVSGWVVDQNSEPVPFCTVLLLSGKDSSLVKGTVTDGEGMYAFESVSPGRLLLRATSVGYRPGMVAVNVPSGQRVELPPLVLYESVSELGEVVVEARKPLYEQKIDRLMVNVESSITAAGSSALEVLQKSPGVFVNRQNNRISLNGKEGVLVMINGKISRMPIEAVVQMLDGMSAANIEKIELISAPPAKYDAEGTAGIIHIVLKENPDQGTNGSLGLTAGYSGAETFGGNGSLFHRGKRLGLLLDYSVRHDRTVHRQANYRTLEVNDFTQVNATNGIRDPFITVQNLRAGLEYLVDHTTVDLLITGYKRHWKTRDITENMFSAAADSVLNNLMTASETNIWQGGSINAGVEHRFTDGQALNVELAYLFYPNRNPSHYTITTTETPSGESVQSEIEVRKDAPLAIRVGKLDYSNDVSDKLKIDAGMKASFSSFENDVRVVHGTPPQSVEIDSLTNVAYLDEAVVAAYASSDWHPLEHIAVSGGMRYEYTHTQMDTLSARNVLDRKFHNFFPSLYFRHQTGDNSHYQLSYSRRITRPTFNDMAPFVYFADPRTFYSGNPALLPALTDALKADWQRNGFLLSLEYSYTKHQIARYQSEINRETNQEVYVSKNLRYLRTWYFNLGLPFAPFGWWDLNANLGGRHRSLLTGSHEDQVPANVVSFTANLRQTFSLPASFTLEVSAFFQSKELWGVWELRPRGSLDVGLQKQFSKNDVLKISAVDILHTNVWKSTTTKLGAAETNWMYDLHIQSFNLTYTHRFGSSKLKKIDFTSGSEEERQRVN